MARANVPRRQGDDFQARLFWLNATLLLDPDSPVTRVTYDTGPKAFDDILIEYDLDKAPVDHEGTPIRVEHVQCKYHTTAGTFGYQDLIEPAFINADRHSLLKRAHQAQLAHAPDGTGLRFSLKTNWRIQAGDPLLELIGKSSGAINLDKLFVGRTDRSRMGTVRKLWREHLGIDDDALRLLARVLAVAETPESLMELRERLDERFAAVGLKRVPASKSSFFYDDLIAKLLAQGRVEFDRDSFWEMARQEGILGKPAPVKHVLAIGVRSFMHAIDNLENRCKRMLDLVPYFDGRYVREEADWQGRIYPELHTFVLDEAQSSNRLRLVLDAHVSLAFAVGALLNVKAGKQIEIEQRTISGRRFWSVDDTEPDPSWPKFVFEDEILASDCDEIAIAIALTHDVSPAVRDFVKQDLQQIRRIVHCKPEGGVSQQSVRSGRHAWQLAESVVQHVLDLRGQGHRVSPPVHIFIAGPNGFALFLGQQQQAIGPACVYEWDFEDLHDGGYSLGLAVRSWGS